MSAADPLTRERDRAAAACAGSTAARAGRAAAGGHASRSRMPRLLFAVDSRFPGLGGAEAQALKLALALRERGASVEFMTPRVLPEQPLEELHRGFRVVRVDYPHVRRLGSLALLVNVARYLLAERERFDAVHVHVTHLVAAAAGLVRRRTALPVVTKVSGFYEFAGGVLDPDARGKPLNRLLRAGLRRVDRVQTISEETREKLVAAGFRAEQIALVPNGIDTREPPPPPQPDPCLRIGYCGRLREVKGVHVLLEGFARARRARPALELELAIAGDGETRAALERQAVGLGIADALRWHGRIDESAIAAFHASLDLYVQPSFVEGLPNAVMEAMLAARAIVASDIGGVRELLVDGASGLLFPAGDATALAERLLALIDDAGARARIGAAGRAVIDARYGFDTVTERLLELYRGLMPSGGVGAARDERR